MFSNEGKVQYSEQEAAEKLGISVSDLRVLVKSHIAKDEEIGSVSQFRPSDLVLLRILASNLVRSASMSA